MYNNLMLPINDTNQIGENINNEINNILYEFNDIYTRMLLEENKSYNFAEIENKCKSILIHKCKNIILVYILSTIWTKNYNIKGFSESIEFMSNIIKVYPNIYPNNEKDLNYFIIKTIKNGLLLIEYLEEVKEILIKLKETLKNNTVLIDEINKIILKLNNTEPKIKKEEQTERISNINIGIQDIDNTNKKLIEELENIYTKYIDYKDKSFVLMQCINYIIQNVSSNNSNNVVNIFYNEDLKKYLEIVLKSR